MIAPIACDEKRLGIGPSYRGDRHELVNSLPSGRDRRSVGREAAIPYRAMCMVVGVWAAANPHD
ncbi:hypothetical protein ABIB82_002860 [Bradyrhizobium sp. i1.8.4]